MKYEFLRHVPLFEVMPEEDLRSLCDSIDEISLPAGEILFREGDAGDKVYIIQTGELEILKQAGQHEVRLALRKTGDVIGEMSLLETVPRSATVRAVTNCALLALEQHELDILLTNSPTAARALLQTVIARLRATNSLLQEREKLAHLGTLSAGIAHELNNPAAAIARSTDHLARVVAERNAAVFEMTRLGLNTRQLQVISELTALAHAHSKDRPLLDALLRLDQETALVDWMEDRDVSQSGDLAASLAEAGFTVPDLSPLAEDFQGGALENLLAWLAALGESYILMTEMKLAANSISAIIQALKSYIYLDQGPVAAVDLNEGLENTLIVMRHKLRNGVIVHRDFDTTLPRIQAYGGELNQVWTNLIDNAVDAMDGKGNLRIRTCQEQGFAVVEIEDDGPGIPDDARSKMFTPFYTTKPQGKGTGLGLSVSYNIIQKHNGMIDVRSEPGCTRFVVRLPLITSA